MNLEELDAWKTGVKEHMEVVDTVINDRKILKEYFEKHLGQFFHWDAIEYNRDFTKISLTWQDSDPVIRNDKINELGMDWIISSRLDNVRIDIYPFGTPKEGEIVFE